MTKAETKVQRAGGTLPKAWMPKPSYGPQGSKAKIRGTVLK